MKLKPLGRLLRPIRFLLRRQTSAKRFGVDFYFRHQIRDVEKVGVQSSAHRIRSERARSLLFDFLIEGCVSKEAVFQGVGSKCRKRPKAFQFIQRRVFHRIRKIERSGEASSNDVVESEQRRDRVSTFHPSNSDRTVRRDGRTPGVPGETEEIEGFEWKGRTPFAICRDAFGTSRRSDGTGIFSASRPDEGSVKIPANGFRSLSLRDREEDRLEPQRRLRRLPGYSTETRIPSAYDGGFSKPEERRSSAFVRDGNVFAKDESEPSGCVMRGRRPEGKRGSRRDGAVRRRWSSHPRRIDSIAYFCLSSRVECCFKAFSFCFRSFTKETTTTSVFLAATAATPSCQAARDTIREGFAR